MSADPHQAEAIIAEGRTLRRSAARSSITRAGAGTPPMRSAPKSTARRNSEPPLWPGAALAQPYRAAGR
jgi:hypothetical protein